MIGSEAKRLDERHIRERMKLERNTIKKILFAILFYILIMLIFHFTI